jgi:copper resistance protein C
VGDYQIEMGWSTEPPITGQRNGIIVNVTKVEEEPVENVSNLVISVAYGGQTKNLTLQPLGEDTPGQFVAPILPSIPGQYTINLGGKLGDTGVSAEVDPEAVQLPNTIQFPLVEASSQNTGFGLAGWLSLLGILLGLAGIGLGMVALRKNR